MRVPDLQPLVAGASALVLLASMGWWLFSEPQLADPGQPKWKGADIVQLTASIPKIADFDHFYVNHDNPFVPHSQRGPEKESLDPRTRPPAQRPPRPPTTPPPKPPVQVVEAVKPVLVLPRLTSAPSNAPITYGMVVSEGEERLIVRMPDAESPMNLKPGDKIAGWTLISIDNGNLATFLDPQGVEHRFAIGQGNLVAQSDNPQAAPSPGSAKPQPGRSLVPKPPVAPGNRPNPPTRVDGPIPRPPPLDERRRIFRRPEIPDGPRQPETRDPAPKR